MQWLTTGSPFPQLEPPFYWKKRESSTDSMKRLTEHIAIHWATGYWHPDFITTKTHKYHLCLRLSNHATSLNLAKTKAITAVFTFSDKHDLSPRSSKPIWHLCNLFSGGYYQARFQKSCMLWNATHSLKKRAFAGCINTDHYINSHYFWPQ